MSETESIGDYEEELNELINQVSEGEELSGEDAQLSVSEEEAPTAAQRPPSKVPLASGKTPAEEQAERLQAQQAVEEQEYLSRPEVQQAVEEDQRALKKEIQQETVKEIVRQRAEAVRKNVTRDATQKAKEQRQLEKLVDKSGYFEEEHHENCRVMNLYRDKYRGRINYRFKAHYTVDMPVDRVRQERREFEVILSTQDLPTVMKDFSKKLCALETGSIMLNLPWLDLSGLEERAIHNVDSGYFDEEFEQLAIRWSSYLARSPEERTAFKFGWMILQTAMENRSGTKRKPVPKDVKERFSRKTSDL